MTQRISPKVSVIVPVLNERATLAVNLDTFTALESAGCELIFVDGGSTDASLLFLQKHFEQVYVTKASRAHQMNVGATKANGLVLVFLHADTYLSPSNVNAISAIKTWGFCLVKLSGKAKVFRFIERGINWRSRVFKVATGDQCLFFERDLFHRLGGFPRQALMEDIEIARRAKKVIRPTIFDMPVTTSSRRWEQRGPVRTVILMWWIQLLYKLGVSPQRLASLYRRSPVTHHQAERAQ